MADISRTDGVKNVILGFNEFVGPGSNLSFLWRAFEPQNLGECEFANFRVVCGGARDWITGSLDLSKRSIILYFCCS